MSPRARILLLAVLQLLWAAPAAAQYINSGPSASRGVTYRGQGAFNEQPLTTNQGDVSVFVGPLANPKFGTNEEAGLHMIHLPGVSVFGEGSDGEFATFFQAGAAYGITRGLEAGLFTPPLLLSPQTGSGDLPLFISAASSVDSVDLGIRTTLTIPVRSDSFWRLNPGLHTLVRFEGGRFDLGAFFPMVFAEDAFLASLEIPTRISVRIVDDLFAGVETGVRKDDIGEGQNDVYIPLGGYLVYSLEAGEHRVDITGRFNWQSFVWVGAPEDWPDRVLEDAYTISLGANMLFDVAGRSSTKKKRKRSPEPSKMKDGEQDEAPNTVRGKPPT